MSLFTTEALTGAAPTTDAPVIDTRATDAPPRRFRSMLSVLVVLLLFVAACGSSADDSDASEESDAMEPASATIETSDAGGDDSDAVEVAAEEFDAMEDEALADADTADLRAGADGEQALGAGGLAVPTQDPAETGRDIIYTATSEIEVEDVAAAGQQATTAISALGGFVFGQSTTTDGVPRSTITFKVPPRDFQRALAALGEIGFLRDQIVTADDVTERVVDLESQIITAELSVERLRGFLENATTLTEIADLEQQLLERETSLERLRGQLRTIQGQVSLATITVTFTQVVPGPELEVDATVYRGHDDGVSCPGFDEIEADEGDPLTLCIRITNTGDTLLGDIDLRDEQLELELDDFTVVDGDLDRPLVVGGSVLLAAEIEADPFAFASPQATAAPVDEDGNDLRLGRTASRGEVDLEVAEDTSLPGFLDGLSAGWAVVVRIVEVAVLSLGFLIPFVWVLPLLWFGRRWWRRRREAAAPPPPVHRSSHPHVPPAPVADPPPPAPSPDDAAAGSVTEPGEDDDAS